MFRNDDERARAQRWACSDWTGLRHGGLAKGDVMFTATGRDRRHMLKGCAGSATSSSPQSIVMRSKTGTVRIIEASTTCR
jgi:fructose-1,6-bisphosphatase II / sedoheptulose-1,7-bisphosphatase